MNKISGVLSVAQCLLTLLRVLPESVVPADAFERFIGINSPKDEILERLCRLYPMHYSLLMYISGSLKPLLTKNKYLRPKQAHIITLFAKIMMPPPVSHKEPSHSLLSMLTEAGEDGSEYATGTSKKWEEFRTSMVQYLIMFN
ncbi:hypothetical protein EV182_006272 [Spiromyces aspiralis]|uniref:Uncharacterized protein n=1 Tax=Spiromyces aspiralis TaxID=68401 RepID=A0ACC1HC91_9FUNG|nr:hypothetical protein EV182_006272 [Spiromyces aspiralis]